MCTSNMLPMQDRSIYEYAVIRLVPRVERDEFINIGVILFCRSHRFLKIKYHLDQKRIGMLHPETDTEYLHDYLKAWEDVCNGGKTGGKIGEMDIASRFRWLTAARSTIIQSSPVHPGICEQPEPVLESLFRKYVL